MNQVFASLCDARQDPMRRRLITALAMLLVVQLGLAVLLHSSTPSYQPTEPTAPLLSWDLSKVTRVIIEEARQKGEPPSRLVLVKEGNSWKLPGYYAFPASTSLIEQFINTLKELKKGLPVSTTSEAAARFKVSSDTFQRAISCFADGQKIGTLYLGSSPAFKAMYARADSGNDVYSVPLSEYQVSTRPDDWIDRTVLEAKPEEITSVAFEQFKVDKGKNGWILSADGKTDLLQNRTVKTLLDSVAHISISAVLGTTGHARYNLDKPALSYKMTLAGGKERLYAFGKVKDNSHYVLKVSDSTWYMEVDTWIVDRIKEITADSLLKAEVTRSSARPAQSVSK